MNMKNITIKKGYGPQNNFGFVLWVNNSYWLFCGPKTGIDYGH